MVQKIYIKNLLLLSGIGKKESYATVIGYPFWSDVVFKNLNSKI